MSLKLKPHCCRSPPNRHSAFFHKALDHTFWFCSVMISFLRNTHSKVWLRSCKLLEVFYTADEQLWVTFGSVVRWRGKYHVSCPQTTSSGSDEMREWQRLRGNYKSHETQETLTQVLHEEKEKNGMGKMPGQSENHHASEMQYKNGLWHSVPCRNAKLPLHCSYSSCSL